MAHAISIELFGLPGPEIQLELEFRSDFKDDEVSECEMEVIGPLLPELIGELMQMAQDKNED